MATAQRDYSALFDEATPLVEAGAELEAQRVFYECHKVSPPRQFPDEDRRVRYRGRLISKARCVDATSAGGSTVRRPARMAAETVKRGSLSADRIGFECSRKPEPADLFRMTGQDRGQRGLLEDDVQCRIVAPAKWVPQKARG